MPFPLDNKKIRIAFVKFGGMAAGGTEKFLQVIAANLNKEKFIVDYYYCDAAPYTGSDWKHPDTSIDRLKYMEASGISLIKFKVGAKDVTKMIHPWVDTDFWEKFDESKYDIIQAARAGNPEYPFVYLKKTPIVDSLHFSSGVDNQFNIARTMHMCQWNADHWIKNGGDKERVVMASYPMDIKEGDSSSMRTALGLDGKFIYGFHQRNDDNIFSPIPLEAYKKIESEDTHFMLLGGGQRYRDQAKDLGIKNITFVEHTSDATKIFSFLKTLDIYSHGRMDGEINSTAMAEALYFGLPIVSHTSKINNGHIGSIADAGHVVDTTDEYAAEMKKLKDDSEYRVLRSKNAIRRFAEHYEFKGQVSNIENIYFDVIKNPFPHPLRRRWMSLRLKYYSKAIPRKIMKIIKARLSKAN